MTHRHNRPNWARVRLHSEDTVADEESRLKIVCDDLPEPLDFHGTVSRSRIRASRTRSSRPPTRRSSSTRVVPETPTAATPTPSFVQTFHTGPQIFEEIFNNSITYEGDMGMVLGTVAAGGESLVGAPTNWPMSLAQIATLLSETGEFDLFCKAIDSGGNMGEVSLYNGDFGANLSGSVAFEFQTGPFNARGCRRTIDKSELANKIRFLLGPRRKTAADPGSLQHWDRSI